MKYSVRNSVKKIAAGLGVAGLMGTGAMAQDNQSYQNPSSSGRSESSTATQPGSERSGMGQRQGQSESQQNQQGQYGQQGQQGQQGQSGMRGSRESASASQGQRESERQSRGTIRSVDSSSKTITLKGPKMHREIAWSSNTEVLRNGKAVSSKELRKGERVNVTFRQEGDRLIAQQIIIQERQQARTGRHPRSQR